MIGQRAKGTLFRKISHNLQIPLSTVFNTVNKTQPDGEEKKCSGTPRGSTKEEDDAMLEAALHNRSITYEEIAEKVAPQVTCHKL